MGECWNLDETLKVTCMDHLLMEKPEVRAMASYFRTFHGADSFVTALGHARALSEAGEIEMRGSGTRSRKKSARWRLVTRWSAA